MEDWDGASYDYWDDLFVSRHANIHVENQSARVYDADDIDGTPSLLYVLFYGISWYRENALFGRMNGLRGHEDAFHHHSDPACLVVFQTVASGDIELRWRLDYRNFADNAPVTGDPVRRYRITRLTASNQQYQWFTTPELTGDEGTFTDTMVESGESYTYLVESIVEGTTIPYSTEVAITEGAAGNTDPVFWLKSRSFVEESYISGSMAPMTFTEQVRFGSANASTTAPARILIQRVYKRPQAQSSPEEGYKALIPVPQYNENGVWSGSDLIFSSFSTGLVDAGGNPFADISAGEIKPAGCFPFRLEYDYSGTPATFPREIDGWADPYYSSALNNRSVAAEWFYYTVHPDNQNWIDATAAECQLIVSDGWDWNQYRPVFQGVWADLVEWTFPGWSVLLIPRDYDESTYGTGMLSLCSAASEAIGDNTLMVNGFDDHFIDLDDIDRYTIDGTVKARSSIYYQGSYASRMSNRRDAVRAAHDAGKPIHIRSHAGMVNPADDEIPNIPLYRTMELIAYWLLMSPGANDGTHTSLGYAGYKHFYSRTLAFPESQIDLGAPDAEPTIRSTSPWCTARSFNGGKAFVVYNSGFWGQEDPYIPADPSYSAREILTHCNLSTTDSEWYRLELSGNDLTTTEGGSFTFVPVDLDTEILGPAHGMVLMQDPPVLPNILEDAHSPVWLSGGEAELEISVLPAENATIDFCEVSIHELLGGTEPTVATTFEVLDDGQGADDVAGDGVFTLNLTSEVGSLSAGEYVVWVYAEDSDDYYKYGRTAVSVAADDLAAKFVDYSEESDIDFTGTPYSSIAFDGNEDAFEDILVTVQGARSSSQVKYQTHPSGCPIYHERIDFDYEGSTFRSTTDCRGLTLGDYDNDGDDDLFAAHASVLLLLENTGPQPLGQFDDASVTGLTATETADSWAGAWGDYNADGWLDLYISRADQDPQGKDYVDADPVSDRFMLGVDGTTFVSSSWFSGVLTDAQPSFAASWCDVERDGDMDLFVPAANADGTSAGARFYETVTESQFEDGLVSWFPDVEIANSTSAAWADLDNDGDLDLVLSQLAGLKPHDPARPYIFLKDDTADSFIQDTTALPLVDLPTWDVRPLDYDLDGWMDLLLIPAQLDATAPSRAPKLYRNACTNPLEFEDVSDASGIGDLASVINGAAPADYDLDGDMDLFLGRPTAGDEGFFFLSEASGTPNSWLGVRLEGSEDIVANRSCIGAQVMVTSLDGGTILSGAQNYGGGAGRGGDAARGLRFGLGAANGPVVVKTYWLNGFVQRDTVAVDQIVTVQDRTPPAITTGSVSIQTTVWPGGLVWGFSWDTEYLLADSVDQVILNGPSTNWANVTITPANAAHALDGTSHSLLGFQTGCAKGVHTVQVKMTSNDQTRAEAKTYNVRVCLSGF